MVFPYLDRDVSVAESIVVRRKRSSRQDSITNVDRQ